MARFEPRTTALWLILPSGQMHVAHWNWTRRLNRRFAHFGDSSAARELTGLSLALQKWSHLIRGLDLVIVMDAAAAVHAINRGRARAYLMREALQRICHHQMANRNGGYIAVWRPRANLSLPDHLGRFAPLLCPPHRMY